LLGPAVPATGRPRERDREGREEDCDQRPGLGGVRQFNPAGMEQIGSTFRPLLQAHGTITEIPAPEALYTNEFIDPSIRMG
jgi:hypothetical protein